MPKNTFSIYLCHEAADFPVDSIHKKSWIEVFKQTLRVLFIQSGLEVPNIYTDEDGFEVEDCEVCLVVLSKGLKASNACMEVMMRAMGKKAKAAAEFSVFKIAPQPLLEDSQPRLIHALPQYDFFEYDPDTELYYEYKNLQRSIDYRYWLKLDDLLYDIVRKHFRKGSEVKETIYLANCTLDLISAREEIKRNLKHWGYHVLPEQPYDTQDEEALAIAIRTHIASSQLSIHVFGEVYGDVVNVAGSSLATLENEIAAEYSESQSLQRLIWLPKEQEIMETKQQTYIEYVKSHRSMRVNAECLETSFEHFKDYIRLQLDLLGKQQAGMLKYQYLFGIMASIKVDWSPIRDWANENGYRFYTFHEQSDWFLVQSLMGNAKAVILATEDGKKEWLSYWSRMLLKVVGYRKKEGSPQLFWIDSKNAESYILSERIDRAKGMKDVIERIAKAWP